MIKSFKAINKNILKSYQRIIHPKALDILFENQRYIKNTFLQIKGFYAIDYLGITIINPDNEIIAFSTTPNIEYNIINQNLWKNDCCFLPQKQKQFIIWNDNEDNKIEQIKLKNNAFNFGMTITRPINNFCFLYSFATKSQASDLEIYYESHLSDLINLGDHFFKSIRDIYSYYDISHKLPELKCLIPKRTNALSKSYLQLIVNNCFEDVSHE